MEPIANATHLLQRLDAEQIRARIREIEDERRALLTLLRCTLNRTNQPRTQRRKAVADAAR